jgi:serine/threonine-protein kinase
MDDRASHHASDEPRPRDEEGEWSPDAPDVSPLRSITPPAGRPSNPVSDAPRSGSSVVRQRPTSSGGSSHTRRYATVTPGQAGIFTDGGSTSRRHVLPGGRIEDQPTVISKQPPSSLTPSGAQLPPTEMGRVLQGEMLGHFELLDFVGGGGMGAVFRALDTMLNRIVAVKVLSHEQSGDEETLRRFKNEAQSAARLDHENISRVHYVGEDRGWHYIVFEFIEGINLRDLVERDGPLPIAEAVSFLLQLGDALAHAAQRDVVHRDIKPSNVLVTPVGKAKLVDMGLARLHQVEHPDNDLTASGVTLGTFDYISPEQARDPRSADVRSDLYSLGCTFYFMLTGRPPFPEGTVLQKLLQHQGDDPPDPRQYCPDLPDDVYRILRRLLAKSPADRYQIPDQLIEDLTAAAVRLGLRPTSPGSMVWLATTPAVDNHWRSTLPWLVPTVALILIVLILNLVWTPSDSSLPPLLGRLPSSVVQSRANASATTDGTAAKDDRAGDASKSDKSITPIGNGPATKKTTQVASNDQAMELSPVVQSAVSKLVSIWESAPWTKYMARVDSSPLISRQSFNSTSDSGDTAGASNASSDSALASQRRRIVAGKAATFGQYAKLGTAIREAKDGDIIELRYDGVLYEEPMDILGRRLTIRAARGRSPVIHFRVDNEDLLSDRRSMVSIDGEGGHLTLADVRIVLTLPRGASDHWSMFELGHTDGLRLENCAVTVRNNGTASDRPTATIVDVRAGLADGAGMMQDSMPQAAAVKVAALQSIFRGGATFLRFAKSRPVELRVENSLVALSEHLVKGDVGLTSGRAVANTLIELRQSTVFTAAGLIRLTNNDTVSPSGTTSSMHVEARCFDSILAAAIGSAMIEQVSGEPAEKQKEQFGWSAERSFYDGFAAMWRIFSPDGFIEQEYSDWSKYWDIDENQTTASTGFADFPALTDRPLHDVHPSDFRLFPDSPANNISETGIDAGAALEKLPRPDPPELLQE